MSDDPRISVVIPCFDQGRFLADAIDSVLAQSRPAHDVIVVDDGSGDDTSDVASRSPEVRCLRQDRRGLGGARSAGLANCDGDAVVFLDADDRLLPDALAVGADALAAHPRCGFVSGHFRYIGPAGVPMPTVTEPCPPPRREPVIFRFAGGTTLGTTLNQAGWPGVRRRRHEVVSPRRPAPCRTGRSGLPPSSGA
jgi:hypothetical protein